jgi:protein gp37
MGSKIGWTDESWNPIIGCSKVSAGCQNCYAEKMAGRLAYMGNEAYQNTMRCVVEDIDTATYNGWSGKTALVEPALDKPLHWKKPRMIFVCSMGDLFHESVCYSWVDKVMEIIQQCPHHTFQILTKRPERMRAYFMSLYTAKNVQRNLWLGVTAENQEMADKRIPILLDIPAKVRFVSVEPMLGPVDLSEYMGVQCGLNDRVYPYSYLSWVIVGCESGPKRRWCNPEWVDQLVNQCTAADVPIFVKQICTEENRLVKMPNWFPQQFPKGTV